MTLTLKRVVLNPLAYVTPFVTLIVMHHLPMMLAFGLIDKPGVGYHGCGRLEKLFHWLLVSFVLHVVLAGLMLLSVLMTLSLRVYHKKRPEVRARPRVQLAALLIVRLTDPAALLVLVEPRDPARLPPLLR